MIIKLLTFFLIGALGPKDSFAVLKPLPTILFKTSGNRLRNFPPTTTSVKSVGSSVILHLKKIGSLTHKVSQNISIKGCSRCKKIYRK